MFQLNKVLIIKEIYILSKEKDLFFINEINLTINYACVRFGQISLKLMIYSL
jgi:hypothetical protein